MYINKQWQRLLHHSEFAVLYLWRADTTGIRTNRLRRRVNTAHPGLSLPGVSEKPIQPLLCVYDTVFRPWNPVCSNAAGRQHHTATTYKHTQCKYAASVLAHTHTCAHSITSFDIFTESCYQKHGCHIQECKKLGGKKDHLEVCMCVYERMCFGLEEENGVVWLAVTNNPST